MELFDVPRQRLGRFVHVVAIAADQLGHGWERVEAAAHRIGCVGRETEQVLDLQFGFNATQVIDSVFYVLFHFSFAIKLLATLLLLLLQLMLMLLLLMMMMLKLFAHAYQVRYGVSLLLLGRGSLRVLLCLLVGFGDLLLVRLKAGTEQRSGVLLHLGCRHVDVPGTRSSQLLHRFPLLRRAYRQPVRRSQMIAQPFGRLERLTTAKVMATVSRGTGTNTANAAGRRTTFLEINRRVTHLHVLRQVVFHGESLVAAEDWTGEKLLGFMVRFHVVVQVGHLSKRSTTVCLNANIGPFSGVKSSMVVQVRDLSECFTTIDTNVWPFVCMNANMVPKIGLLRKTFLTIFTNILLLRGMVAYVVQQ